MLRGQKCYTIGSMPAAGSLVSVEGFVRELRSIPEADFTLERIHRFLREHVVAPDTLGPYLVFDPQHYTRNLIDKTELYELLAICWEPGQSSSIHNHHEQNCWMAAPIGRLVSQNYRVREQDESSWRCKLAETDSVLLTPTEPLPVNPSEPVHRVYNPREFGERAVSLHIYSRPFDRCLVYSPEQNKYGEIKLTYTTMYGRTV